MLKTMMGRAVLGLVCATWCAGLLAQGPPPGPDMTIDAAVRRALLAGVSQELKAFYVFPDVAARMADAVEHRHERGEYDSVTSAKTFAQTLTAHLREVSGDKHLAVNYSSTVLPLFPYPPAPPSADDVQRMTAALSQRNFGFEKVERLAGNIGYLDLRGFVPPSAMGETAAAAMTFLGHTAALIVDLRQNGGGSPEAVSLLASYFFDRTMRLNDIYDRPSNETRQFWTLPHVPGKRFVGRDVYLLTSSRTFSAAEDFSYALKNLKRVTIVGEVTGGGAHPVGPRRLSDHFVVVVPMGRSLSTITNTDWEGTGIEPDIKVPATQALHTAYVRALEQTLATMTDPPMKTEILRAIEDAKRSLASDASR